MLSSATEIVCALGLGDSLVAVSHECDYPSNVTSLPRITSSFIADNLDSAQIDDAVVKAVREGRALYQVDGDKLAELCPDLIVTQGVCDVCAMNLDTVEQTLEFLPKVIPGETEVPSLSGKTFEGILRDIRLVAKAAGVVPKATELIQTLREDWCKLETTQPAAHPKVLMLEWSDPPFYAGHWVPEMVEVAGGTDVLGKAGQDSKRITWTEIAKTDPDIIIVMACGYDLAKNTEFAKGLYAHTETKQLRAVKEGQVWACDANSFFSRPAPRVVRGAELLQLIFSGAEAVPGEMKHVTTV